jgi:hypothetical protein
MLHDPKDPSKFEKMTVHSSFAHEKQAEDAMSRLKRPLTSRAVVYDAGPIVGGKRKYSGEEVTLQSIKRRGKKMTWANMLGPLPKKF